MRDTVVVSATLPRFLDVGDRSQLSVDIDNVDGDAGDYTLDLDLHGPLTADADALRRTLHLDAHQRRSAAIPIAAAGVGVADFDLRLTGPNADQAQRFKLGDRLRRAGRLPPHRDAAARAAGARRSRATCSPTSSPEPARSRVSASPFGALDAPALLQALDRYPYGCSEQTVSRAMPLLYANRLASLENLGVDPDLDGPGQAGDRARDEPAERQRRLRHVGGRQRRRRRVARRLSSPTS